MIVPFDQQIRKTKKISKNPTSYHPVLFVDSMFSCTKHSKLDNMGRSTLDQCESWWGDHKMYLFWYYLICDTAGVNTALPAPSTSSTSSLVFDTSQPINQRLAWTVLLLSTNFFSEENLRWCIHPRFIQKWHPWWLKLMDMKQVLGAKLWGEVNMIVWDIQQESLPLTPPKFNRIALKNDDWKTILSFWLPVKFQWQTVELPSIT